MNLQFGQQEACRATQQCVFSRSDGGSVLEHCGQSAGQLLKFYVLINSRWSEGLRHRTGSAGSTVQSRISVWSKAAVLLINPELSEHISADKHFILFPLSSLQPQLLVCAAEMCCDVTTVTSLNTFKNSDFTLWTNDQQVSVQMNSISS